MTSTQLARARSAARLEDTGRLLRALSAPIRLAVIEQLAEGPRRVYELVGSVGVSQSLVSQHLRVLRAARLVSCERHGREIVYTLTDVHLMRFVREAITQAEEHRG